MFPNGTDNLTRILLNNILCSFRTLVSRLKYIVAYLEECYVRSVFGKYRLFWLLWLPLEFNVFLTLKELRFYCLYTCAVENLLTGTSEEVRLPTGFKCKLDESIVLSQLQILSGIVQNCQLEGMYFSINVSELYLFTVTKI